MSEKILGNTPQGLLFVISAPAGTGKSTLVEMIVKEFGDAVAESCSCTTRPPRPGEIAKTHYEFLSREEFREKVQAGEFMEHAEVFGYQYGTRIAVVKELQAQGKHVVLVIDTQGAMMVKEKMKSSDRVVFIFISPPSMEELRRRLFKRRTESEEKMEERLLWAQKEMAQAEKYDYHIVNDNLEVTYEVLKSIFIAEEHKTRRK